MMRNLVHILIALLIAAPAWADDPIRITGPEQSKLNNKLPDGGIPPAVGVRNIQVFRASRDDPGLTDGKGFTYNHHVDICCWKGWLYVAWDNGQKDEDTWPARELYSISTDGDSWTRPAELFPMGISNPLRMYFYHTKNGRMLAIAARRVTHDKIKDPTEGGILVRELLADHSLGPVYILIEPAKPTDVPAFFQESTDQAFVQACRQLLDDHTFLEQQDYGVLLGAQKMKPYDGAPVDFGKAFCFFHRKDGALIGIGKKGWVVQSSDDGKTWSNAVQLQDFKAGTAKEWIQRTIDGKFAWAHDPFPTDRFPLVVLGGDDGITFSNMRVVHGEVPRQRYAGADKNIGPQYVRGISEWNSDGSIKDAAMWLAYSVNKEDIWVSRIPIPLQAEGNGWNTYAPRWAEATIEQIDGGETVTLEDHDPCDYARADRIFQPAAKVAADFEILPKRPGPHDLEIELWGQYGDARPVRLALKPGGVIELAGNPIGEYSAGKWIKFHLDADATRGEFDLSIDGKSSQYKFADATDSLNRLVFRTGEYRLLPIRGNEIDAGSDGPTESSEYAIRGVAIR